MQKRKTKQLHLPHNKKEAKQEFDIIDRFIVQWMSKHGLHILRYSLAIVFIWFGILKPFGSSPANALVANLMGGWVDPTWFIPFLGFWEVAIGLCLLWKPLVRIGIALMAFQMVGTFLPLVFLPSVVYDPTLPFLTLEGQYIVKNLVLIGAAIVIGSHGRDGKL